MFRESLEWHLGQEVLEPKRCKREPEEQAIWRHAGENAALFEELYSTVQSSTFIHMEDTHMRACMDSLVNGLTTSHTSTYVDTLR